VKAAATPVAVSSAAQKSTLPRQGPNKAEEAFASAAVSAMECNGRPPTHPASAGAGASG
jgi:hypothetical protein